jgi:astacin (peptidase family M12A)
LGDGCADPGTTLWWANFPVNLNVPGFRACRLNAYLRSGMALNKILHEIGHSLGLWHEHERTDVPLSDPMVATCYQDVSYFGKGVSQGGGVTLVTPYDRDSVMHYEINHRVDPWNVPATSTCDLGNDNGSTGLSGYDQLSLRILYPHPARVAEYSGATVARAGQQVHLRNQWGEAGALVANVVRDPPLRGGIDPGDNGTVMDQPGGAHEDDGAPPARCLLRTGARGPSSACLK